MANRIEGYDFARALAVFGMVFVNFKIVLGSAFGSDTLAALVSLIEGRASALFVVLAGVGLTLMTANTDRHSLLHRAAPIWRRGALLLVTGLALATVWPADILHFYGFYFLFAAFFIAVRDVVLWLCAGAAILIFLLLLMFCDYESGWHFDSLVYHDFWTVEGMLRHIFFNGFHPVFPWIAFVFVGMWLGRQPLNQRRTRSRLLRTACIIWCVTEVISKAFTWALEGDVFIALADTEAMPPTPLYSIAASSLAIAIICGSINIVHAAPGSLLVRAMVHTGRLSLTIYIAHIFIGMGVLEALGFLEQQSIEVAILSAGIFCVFSTVFSWLWLRHFKRGPFEYLFRICAGR